MDDSSASRPVGTNYEKVHTLSRVREIVLSRFWMGAHGHMALRARRATWEKGSWRSGTLSTVKIDKEAPGGSEQTRKDWSTWGIQIRT